VKLAKLELSGFKSFADYTEFHFDDGITGIVGPNGCGKSNVVDAVKWVLGEMSAKSLRGDAMMDVIFNGSGNRKPMGMAEVSLTFSNPDRFLPMDADTVKITRRLYRDATSEYLINNQSSRLKDIRELFLDTGIGVDAYSLIEQGRVMTLLEANSVDRREIFEEAAGISRFKARKKETLRKLEKTDQNLAQTTLVLEEVERQLRSVKVQAGRARSYQEYATRLKELRSAYAMQEYDQLFRKQAGLVEKLDGVVDELGLARRGLEEKRSRQQELQMELEAAQDAARKAERELLSAQSEHQSAKQRCEFAQQQIGHLEENRVLLGQRQTEFTERLAARQAETKQHEELFAVIDQRLRDHEAEVAEASLKQEQASKAIATINRTIDENKSKAIDLMRQIGRLNNEINGLCITQENLVNQRGRLETRREQIEGQIKELKAKVAQLEEQKEDLTTRSSGLQEQSEEVREQQQANNQKQGQISQELARVREHRSGLMSRLNVLKDLQAKREGVSQVVREVLKARDAGGGFGYVKAMVGDVFGADLENAAVVEAALGELQHAVVVSEAGALVTDCEVWRKLGGRGTAWALDRLPAFQDGYDWSIHGDSGKAARRAIDLVKYDAEYSGLAHHLLGKTLVVGSLGEAAELAEAGARGYRFVTLAGEVLEADGSLQLGDMSKRGGMISRRAEVEKLAEELVQVETSVTALTEQIAQGEQQSRTLDGSLQELRQQIYQADSARAEVNAQLQQTASQLQRTAAEAPLIKGEIESLQRQAEQALDRQGDLQANVGEFDEQSKAVEAVIHEMGAQVIVRQHEVAELSEAATRARVAMGQVQEQRSSLSKALAVSRLAVSQTQMELQRIGGEILTVEARMNDARQIIATSEAAIAELLVKAEGAQARLTEHSERLGTLRSEYSSVVSGLETLQERAEMWSRQEHELSLATNELTVRIETLINHAQEELQINLPERYTQQQVEVVRQAEAAMQAQLAQQAEPTAEGQEVAAAPEEPAAAPVVALEAIDWDAVAAEINDLKGKIGRLGNVNLDAINELSSLEERHAFITAQVADITEAKRQLEELIGKINEDSRQRFIDTFEAVRKEFQEMFRKLFGGGKADLVLENPEDVLESGIEIMARPPGKEPQSMSLLSGGEKTMTAVALVMAIFKSKPSPFCILDEVDAALDEANTARFASIVQEFLAISQFIVITHNKRTMSVASVLYGVTMQEQGVSKRVAVKFDQKGAPVIGTGGGPKPEGQSEAA